MVSLREIFGEQFLGGGPTNCGGYDYKAGYPQCFGSFSDGNVGLWEVRVSVCRLKKG
jgi:hypothetical protein